MAPKKVVKNEVSPLDVHELLTPAVDDANLRMSYRIARGEQGVLTFANHKGGRKYDRSERELERDGGVRSELPKSEAHEGRDEKLGASEVFKEVWKLCTSNESYLELKTEFLAEQKVWDREQKKKVKKEEKVVVKDEEEDD
ncbi:hypothetical protein LTS10_001583 [Elasticomyces elasticus]|nr:hypothetical protein LTS10_001583 [Elasticomyces elasticus]